MHRLQVPLLLLEGLHVLLATAAEIVEPGRRRRHPAANPWPMLGGGIPRHEGNREQRQDRCPTRHGGSPSSSGFGTRSRPDPRTDSRRNPPSYPIRVASP